MEALGLLRSMVKVSQATVAKRAGVSRETLVRAEAGEQKVSRAMWERVNHVLMQIISERMKAYLTRLEEGRDEAPPEEESHGI